MLRLYQWLHRRASLLFSVHSKLHRPVTTRRVVTFEWEERVLLVRPRSTAQCSTSDERGETEHPEQTLTEGQAAPPRPPDQLDD